MNQRSVSRTASSQSQRSATPLIATSSLSDDLGNELVTAGAKLYTVISEVTTLVNEVVEGSKGKAKGESVPFLNNLLFLTSSRE
jgi:hypothetical protein